MMLQRVLLLIVSTLFTSSVSANDALVAKMTADIDRHLAADWAARNIKPAARADDAAFLRRVSLDILGRIPRAGEVNIFLADRHPDKRNGIITKLLAQPAHAKHFASVIRTEWLPQTHTDNRFFNNGVQFQEWLEKRLRKNERADTLVRELLTLGITSRFAQLEGAANNSPDFVGASAFYEANEVRPENLAATASRIFLGVKLECAQCHDHPFAPLTKQHFWQTAAFFGEFAALPPIAPSFVGPLEPQFLKNRITIPNTTTLVVAKTFDGDEPNWSNARTPRDELASWLTAKSNPYFARNQVNRMWARFFGIGLIDPVDEPGDTNPPSHPELLDDLVRGYLASGFDNHVLIRAIVGSQAYQLSSRLSHPSQGDPRRFAKMSVRGLNGLQLYESFVIATGYRGGKVVRDGVEITDFRATDLRGQFQQQFPFPLKQTDSQTSILQALLMMNGLAMQQMTDLKQGELLLAIADAPVFSTAEKVDSLFLATLGRRPTDDEREKYTSYVDRINTKQALADVFWVLLNSTEFLFNH
jgi:Protein of unknown function (DUF1553)/Protein of unknown function (DUF1549)